jgi:hypothetical protein
MGQSFMQGVEVIDHLLFSKKEQTVHWKVG